ncbi:MAG: rhomboid family intramembrane serine protease [Lachnospiraceae bacterium]|nr:rhomboid family intramembrane serine protease [Lachnospiraceae bacterium]
MENSKKQSHIERYGKVNIIIAVLCAIFLVVNSVIVSESALNQLASNKYLAYILNFLAGCEGKLGTIGSMSNAKVFGDGEWWRLFLHIYLHAGVLHMLFNIFALLYAGKVVEKKIGSWPYVLLYHAIAVVNAIIMCLIFPDSISVGASAGIFGMIGIVCVMKWKKDTVCNENLKKGEFIYIIVFSVLSLLLGLESFVTHFVAFVFGIIVGFLFQKKSKCE